MENIFKPKIILPGKASQKITRVIPESSIEEDRKLRQLGCDYAEQYRKAEEELYDSKQNVPGIIHRNELRHGTLSEVDTVTNFTASETTCEDNGIAVYNKYCFQKRKCDGGLLIHENKDRIVSAVETHKVVIIKGITGCGKTTQVPQFILDSSQERKIFCNVVVTQPRRLATVSVAKRVCQERNCKLGSLVGYQIGQNKMASDDTRILYCTTGILLQKLIAAKHMKEFTHIILDEIHERDQEMDFLLLIVRKMLNTNSRNVKIILMSATIDTENFSAYFYTMVNGNKMPAMVYTIPEKKKYTVRKYFLDDIKNVIPEANDIVLDVKSPEIGKKSYVAAVRLIQAFDSLDEGENGRNASASKGSVLVFLPGLREIEEMESNIDLKRCDQFSKDKRKYLWEIFPLHSSITYEEQKAVFGPVSSGYRKIILSTNIAESSITVPDVKYVIDFCLTKVLVTDHYMNFCSLKLDWASRNSLMQRAGRVGRVADGRVYRLITKDFYENCLEQEAVPEILRCPLDRLVLQTKLLDMGEPKAIFAIALSQPDLRNIVQTVSSLKEIGALLVTVNEKPNPYDGDLTRLGQVCAKLPMDPRLGKLIFLGSLFKVMEECIVMACAMSVQKVFTQPFKNYLDAYNSKLSWADSSCSDCIAFYNAYRLWRKRKTEGYFSSSNEREIVWTRDRYVEVRTLREIATLENDIKARLQFLGLHSANNLDRPLPPAEKAFFLKLAIAGAFYPNFFFRGSQGGQISEKDAVNTLNGHDPFSSVYLQGMPPNQPAVLYKNVIQKKFNQISRQTNVICDSGTKIIVNFGRTDVEKRGFRMAIPGKVDLAVYRAVKMRQGPDFKFRIPVLNPSEASEKFTMYHERYQQYLKSMSLDPLIVSLPWPWRKDCSPLQKYSEFTDFRLSFMESPSHFWIHSNGQLAAKLLYQLSNEWLVSDHLVPTNGDIAIGKLYATPYYDRGRESFYRCRILSKQDKSNKYNIYFIDYGNREKVEADKIFRFSPELLKKIRVDKIPDLAVECSLSKIQPRLDDGSWSMQAVSLMRDIFNAGPLLAKIYSIVNDIALIKVILPEPIELDDNGKIKDIKKLRPNPREEPTGYIKKRKYGIAEEPQKLDKKKYILTLNQLLVHQSVANATEESYLAWTRHEERKKVLKMMEDNSICMDDKNTPINMDISVLEDLDCLFNEGNCHEVVLKGPYSPLEMKIYSVNQCSQSKLVNIEKSSVNSVLLDTNPADLHERMVVAAYIGTNESGDKLTLRHTTIMPNLPGLPALVCMLFAPMVELRSNPMNTKFSGALCGLGYDKGTKESLFPENDIELIFDVEITLEDVVKINKIRFWLNRVTSVSSAGEPGSADFFDCQSKLVQSLSNLFKQPFELQDIHYNVNSFKWGLIPECNLLNPCNESLVHKHPADDFSFVYRLIWGITLDGNMEVEKEFVSKNLYELKEFAEGKSRNKCMECILCRVQLPNSASAKLHLKSGSHKIRQKRYDAMEPFSAIPSDGPSGSRTNRHKHQ